MNRSTLLMTALLGTLSLAACERETVVTTPANPPVVASTDPAPAPQTQTVPVPVPVPVPGPAGPQGEPGKPGDPGPQGAPGKPGDSTVVVVPPAASAPTTN